MSDARDALAEAIDRIDSEVNFQSADDGWERKFVADLRTLIAAARAQAERGAVAEGGTVPRVCPHCGKADPHAAVTTKVYIEVAKAVQKWIADNAPTDAAEGKP